jgi:putative endonuclease
MNPGKWCVYMVRCSDGTLYCGITNNVEKRTNDHNHTKKGAKYTSRRRPVTLAYVEECGSKSAAMSRERQVKKMSKSSKENLVDGYSN